MLATRKSPPIDTEVVLSVINFRNFLNLLIDCGSDTVSIFVQREVSEEICKSLVQDSDAFKRSDVLK